MIYKAQTKRVGIPRPGYHWGYAGLKDKLLPTRVVLEETLKVFKQCL